MAFGIASAGDEGHAWVKNHVGVEIPCAKKLIFINELIATTLFS